MESDDHKIAFWTLTPQGMTNVRLLTQKMFLACPHCILDPEHYREDGTCKCDSQKERDRLKKMGAGYRKSDWAKIPLREED